MFTAVSNNNTAPSYIVASTTAAIPANNNGCSVPNPALDSSNGPSLSDIKIICIRKKRKSKRHIQVIFVETRPLSSSSDQACIELISKSSGSSHSSTVYHLSDCLSFEYFDSVKNDFQSFIYAYFESFTISIFFTDDHLEKKSILIKHLENISRGKSESLQENSANNAVNNVAPDQGQLSIQPNSQQSILPCASTTENILHTFDVHLIPFDVIIPRDHVLIGAVRLYFTTTDLYIASVDCKRADLRVTITNQCPSKEKAILCIPYFTIKNYGNRSNIFLVELGKSTYGNGEIHMKCKSSSLASTIHLLVSPVIEERPLILSSAFQNQLLTHKRMEKSKNIHPPIQLSNETNNPTNSEPTISFLKPKPIETIPSESRSTPPRSNDIKARLFVGFFRSITKNVAHLRRSATFHHHSSINNANQPNSSLDSSLPLANKSMAFEMNEKILCNNQHQLVLPESQKKADLTGPLPVELTSRKSNETNLLATPVTEPVRTSNAIGTYIDMGPTTPKNEQNLEEIDTAVTNIPETTTTVDVGVNTTISLSPQVRSAIIVGTSVHLIAEEKTPFPIGQRSFTSPASVMQPFKTQLHGQSANSPYFPSSNGVVSSPNSSNSLHQPNSASNSQQSLLLSYGIVTFNNNNNNNPDLQNNEQNERPISPPLDGSTIDRRLNSDLSLVSLNQQQTQPSIPSVYSFDNVLSSSSSHIFRTLSVSATNIGENLSGSIRTPRGSIILLDEHLNDQTTTYLLGPPTPLIDDSVPNGIPRLSSVNLTHSMSRAHLSHIDEEKTLPIDPYAMVEPLPDSRPVPSVTLINPVPRASESVDYADLLPLSSLPVIDHVDPNDNSTVFIQTENQADESNEIPSEDQEEQLQEQAHNISQRSSSLLYSDIDYHQTRRRDRMAQIAAKAKQDDQTPPFLL